MNRFERIEVSFDTNNRRVIAEALNTIKPTQNVIGYEVTHRGLTTYVEIHVENTNYAEPELTEY